MKQSQRNKLVFLLLAAVTLSAICYSADRLFIQGTLSWHRQQREYAQMMAEAVLLFCLFSVFLGMIKDRRLQVVGVTAVLAVFSWIHAVFLPVLISGIYIGYMMALGRFLRTKLWKLSIEDGLAADFLAGSAAVILMVCAMSAVGIGAIPYVVGAVLVTGALLFVRAAVSRKKRANAGFPRNEKSGDGNLDFKMALCFSFILTMICIQMGRMNIALDFDSLWYGVRSPYILDNGHGIYENLGTIGIVYTYSKGWEVMALPLAILPSYSFSLAFNLWLTIGVLCMARKVAGYYMGREKSLLFMMLLSSLPGTMNMAVTTKSDIATLLFQLILIEFVLRYLTEGRDSWRYLSYGIAAFLISWTLKPTAMVFSTAIFGMSGLFFIAKRLLPRLRGNWKSAGSIGMIAAALLALMGIWARTMIITGVPVTSVFSSFLTKIGFQMKYPFEINAIPNSGADLSVAEWCRQFAKRVFEFLLRPVGQDMDHVILAWGGFLLFFLILLWISCLFFKKRVENGEEKLLSSYLNTIFLPFLFVNLVSLAMLTQVDGNYFMLLYVLALLYVFRLVERIGDGSLQRFLSLLCIPVLGFLAVVTSMTNWSGTVGFSPVSIKHPGYYNHQEGEWQDMEATGNGRIWDLLAENPENRVIGVGAHPQVLAFPCNIQSYDDITGTWGNVVLVKKMDYFVEFMDYAKTDYVYAEAGYMEESARCYTLVRDLIEYGKLVPVYYEEGNMLAKVDVDGEYTGESRAALTEFQKCYITKTGN